MSSATEAEQGQEKIRNAEQEMEIIIEYPPIPSPFFFWKILTPMRDCIWKTIYQRTTLIISFYSWDSFSRANDVSIWFLDLYFRSCPSPKSTRMYKCGLLVVVFHKASCTIITWKTLQNHWQYINYPNGIRPKCLEGNIGIIGNLKKRSRNSESYCRSPEQVFLLVCLSVTM